jgi:hypothetical protein
MLKTAAVGPTAARKILVNILKQVNVGATDRLSAG